MSDLIEQGRKAADAAISQVGVVSPFSEVSTSLAQAYGLLALAEQMKRLVDLFEESEGEAAKRRATMEATNT